MHCCRSPTELTRRFRAVQRGVGRVELILSTPQGALHPVLLPTAAGPAADQLFRIGRDRKPLVGGQPVDSPLHAKFVW